MVAPGLKKLKSGRKERLQERCIDDLGIHTVRGVGNSYLFYVG